LGICKDVANIQLWDNSYTARITVQNKYLINPTDDPPDVSTNNPLNIQMREYEAMLEEYRKVYSNACPSIRYLQLNEIHPVFVQKFEVLQWVDVYNSV
jgi:hypothetical protein